MNALVSVVVDNCVLVTTLVAVLVSIFALILWRTRKRTDGSETGVDEDLLTDDATPRAKKTAKRPKKSKAEKTKPSIANGHVPNTRVTPVKSSPDASKPRIDSPATKQPKPQKSAMPTKKQHKLSTKANKSENGDGEWTEVPSRRKLRTKREVTEQQTPISGSSTAREPVVHSQQDSPSTADTASAENSADFKTNELPEGGNETETVEKSSTGRDEEIKEDKSPTAAAAITAKTARNAEKKKARKQKTVAAAAASGETSVNSEDSLTLVNNDTVTGQVHRPAEQSVAEAVIPTSSTAVVPESAVTELNTSVPKPVEPSPNKSIPAATAVKSSVAFDELGDEPALAAVNKRKKKARREN